ncbi:hypothetical protein BDR03DRAFT_870546 [Suillus americanus]|nr:hypothetical protein BDR03DRAFT_870546 [Suillus americanus]
MGRYISKERKQIALQMSLLNIKDPAIYRYTGISERSMRYLRKTYRETGEVVRTPICTGRPRIFLEACIERQPDILLTEMQDQLVLLRFQLQQFQERYVGEGLHGRR